jgi:serine/threonine protein kinase
MSRRHNNHHHHQRPQRTADNTVTKKPRPVERYVDYSRMCDVHERYDLGELIGRGIYGTVLVAKPKYENAVYSQVAVKRIESPDLKKATNDDQRRHEQNKHEYFIKREIDVMQRLDHINIMQLIEVAKDTRNQIFFIYQLARHDLHAWLKSEVARIASPGQIKSYALQLINAVAYCHERNVLHRDLKPQNVLIMHDNVIKLTDFGLAKIITPEDTTEDANNKPIGLTNYVITRWYRPPELFLQQGKKWSSYTDRVDVWSVGCIIAEMLVGCTVFPGKSDDDQLTQIWQIRGSGSSSQWPAETRDAYRSSVRASSKHEVDDSRAPFGERIRRINTTGRTRLLTPRALDMLFSMLTCNPLERPSMKSFVTTAYFTEESPQPYRPDMIIQYGHSYFTTASESGGMKK